MSTANKRENLLPDETLLLYKLSETIESLAELNKILIDLLAQHISIEEYEQMFNGILKGNDVIIM